MQEKQTRLALKLIAPIIIVVASTLVALSIFSYNISEKIYTYQNVSVVSNTVKLTRDILNDGWKRTYGTTLRSHEILKKYVTDVLTGSINFLEFPQNSGLIIVDSHTENILATFPQNVKRPKKEQIRRGLRARGEAVETFTLPNGGTLVSAYFSPVQVHIIGFNFTGFTQTSAQQSLSLMMITIFLITALLLTSLIIYLLGKHVLSPLKKMSQTMGGILEEDKFNLRVALSGSKELQSLGTQFNTLISHVQKRDNELQKHNKNLEKVVAERTKELREAQEQIVLQERLAAIGEFASSVAHELRNPLASIKMGVEKVAENDLPSTDKRRIELVNKEVIRLDAMLKGILSFAAPRPTVIQDTALTPYLEEHLPIFEALAHEENVTFAYEPHKQNLNIKADSDKLLQALINITKNACEAALKESDITLSFKKKEKNVLLIVHNEGEPIPKEILARLFEPFYTTKKSGTGLGLATTRRVCQEMGGDISVQSTKTAGTTVTITLKLA